MIQLETKKDTNDKEVLDCPFCGSKAIVEHKHGRGWIISCNDFTCVCQQYGHPTKKDAIEAWNRRA